MNDQQIMTKWNSFPAEQKNMPFAEFRKTLKKLTDPVGIKRDLTEIQRLKTMQKINKNAIDRRLRHG